MSIRSNSARPDIQNIPISNSQNVDDGRASMLQKARINYLNQQIKNWFTDQNQQYPIKEQLATKKIQFLIGAKVYS